MGEMNCLNLVVVHSHKLPDSSLDRQPIGRMQAENMSEPVEDENVNLLHLCDGLRPVIGAADDLRVSAQTVYNLLMEEAPGF